MRNLPRFMSIDGMLTCRVQKDFPNATAPLLEQFRYGKCQRHKAFALLQWDEFNLSLLPVRGFLEQDAR